MNHKLTRTVLAFSGVLASLIGGFVLLDPHAFFAMNGVVIGADPNLLSEIRAPGGVLIIAGVIMLTGSVRTRSANTALATGILVFGGYGLARIVSMAMDGRPSVSLIAAAAIEFTIAVILALIRAGRPVGGEPAEQERQIQYAPQL